MALRAVSALLAVTLLVPGAIALQRTGSTITNDQIFSALGLREGTTVCEMGAGDGDLTIAAAKIVGPSGRVYTSELGDDRLRTLRERTAAANLPHIVVVEADAAKTNLPDGACDTLFMRNVYHHFADPAAMTVSIREALKPGGRLAVVDFTPPGKEADSPADRDADGTHGVSAGTVMRELKQAGFVRMESEAGADRWFIVVAVKPEA